MANPATLKPQPFKKGYDPRRNLKGKTKGTKNFKTIFEMACKEVAKSLNLKQEPNKVMLEIVKRGVKECLKGNYSFYRDTLDRYFGTATQKQEIEIKGKPLPILENLRKQNVSDNNSNQESKPDAEKD